MAIGEQPRRRLIGRAAAGDHVARHRPRRAAEADQRHVAGQRGLARARRSRTPARAATSPAPRAARRNRRRSRSASSRGPSPLLERTLWPSASGTTRMSENRIAASKPKRRIGCSVASAASVGRVAEVEERRRLGADLAIFGQIAAGLAHQPDRRGRLADAGEGGEEWLCRRGAGRGGGHEVLQRPATSLLPLAGEAERRETPPRD